MANKPATSRKYPHREVADEDRAPLEGEERYRHLVEQAPDVIWHWRTVPPEGFDYVSPVAASLLGSVERFTNFRSGAIHPDDRDLFIDQFETFNAEGVDEAVFTLRLIREDGPAVWTETTLRRERNDKGATLAVEGVTRDITERIRSLNEREADRNEFLGALARELRNPVAALKGAVALITQAGESSDVGAIREFVRIVDEHADRLLELANDLLDTSDVEKASFSLKTAPLNLPRMIEEVESVFHRSGFPNELQIKVPAEMPPILADKPKLVQVLGHLLANAASLSPASAPIVLSAEYDDLFATLRIEDQGRGIRKDKLQSLFRRPSESQRVLDYGPLHFGLAIARRIVETHGGRIWADSEGEGRGTTFSFTIPVAQQELERTAKARTLLRDKGRSLVIRRGPRTAIMGVDDDPQVLRLLKTLMEEAGYRFVAASDPTEAVKLAQEEEPELILLDIRFPEASGFDLLQLLRETSDSPVIFLSVSTGEDDIVRGLQLGADDYIFKPFSPPELLARIQSTLRRRPEPRARDKSVSIERLTVDFVERRVTLGGEEVPLSATEYKLLRELAAHAGLVLTHSQILQRVWGPNYEHEVELVRTFIRNLRHKLGDDAVHPRYIITHPGIGYRMAKPA